MKSNEVISLLEYVIEDLKHVDEKNFSQTCHGVINSLNHLVEKLIKEKIDYAGIEMSDTIIQEISQEDFQKIADILDMGSQNFEQYEQENLKNEKSNHLSLVVDNDNPNFNSPSSA